MHYLLDREPTPDEEDMLAAMHLGTERHAATSLMVSAMLSDYRSLAGRLSRELPFANAVQTDWIGEARSWLARHAPSSVVWPMASHMAFWDSPAEFNDRFHQFLLTAS